ncbi:MAG: hypothetical protein ACJ8AF_05030 [Gemmatimonadaceae bacterium]
MIFHRPTHVTMGVGAKPEGVNYYPSDMTKAEFETAVGAGGARADSLKSLYTVVRRDAAGKLYAIPFHQIFAAHHRLAASKLREAAALERRSLARQLQRTTNRRH